MATNTQISTATNLQGPDISAGSSQNNASKYFNNFYASSFNISADANAAILTFFQQYTGNADAGQNLAAAVVYTALAQKLNPMVILDEFQKLSKGELNNYLVAFLNITRSPTSILGTRHAVQTNPYVARTVLI